MAYSVSPAATVASQAVSESWHNANKDDYVWTQMPIVEVLGPLSNFDGMFSYKLANLANFILRTARGYSWLPGDSQRAIRKLTAQTITALCQSLQLDPTSFPAPQVAGIPVNNPVKDAQRQVPEHLSLLYALRELELYLLLTDNAVFGDGAGGQLSFTGTEAISVPDETGDQKPIHDIRDVVNAISFWTDKRPGEFKTVAIMDRITMTALMTNPHFHGAGAGGGTLQVGGSGSGTAGLAEMSGIKAALATLGVDEVHIMKAIGNTANEGGTDAFAYLASPFLHISVISKKRRFKVQNLRDEGPDGAFAIAQEFEPWVKDWHSREAEADYWAGRDNFIAFDVRGSVFGRTFTGNIT